MEVSFPHKYIVSDEYRFIYFVVQKVACTSIKTALVPLFDMDTSPYEHIRGDGSKGIRVHKLFGRSAHQIGSEQLLERLHNGEYEGYFKFAFVRNPWSRLVSCYLDKLVDGRPGIRQPDYGEARLYVGMPFTEFVEAVHAIPEQEANIHFRSQHKTICDQGGNIMADFVGHFENLQEDFDYVSKKIGAPNIQLPHLLRSKNREGRAYTEFYDDRLIGLVDERYQNDIELFGY